MSVIRIFRQDGLHPYHVQGLISEDFPKFIYSVSGISDKVIKTKIFRSTKLNDYGIRGIPLSIT